MIQDKTSNLDNLWTKDALNMSIILCWKAAESVWEEATSWCENTIEAWKNDAPRHHWPRSQIELMEILMVLRYQVLNPMTDSTDLSGGIPGSSFGRIWKLRTTRIGRGLTNKAWSLIVKSWGEKWFLGFLLGELRTTRKRWGSYHPCWIFESELESLDEKFMDHSRWLLKDY